MKKFKPITDDQLNAMTMEERLLALSGMHQALHEKFRPEITKVIVAGILGAEEAGRDPREIVIILAAKDDPFFLDSAREKFENDYNAFWVFREVLLNSGPGATKKHPYHDHWIEAAETTDKGLKCLVIAYGSVSVVNMEVEMPKVVPAAEVLPVIDGLPDLDTGVSQGSDSGTTLSQTE